MARRDNGRKDDAERPPRGAPPQGASLDTDFLSEPSSGVRHLEVEKLLRESLETVVSPAKARALLERALTRAGRSEAPKTAAELAIFADDEFYQVTAEALGAQVAVQVHAHVTLFVGALRGHEAADGADSVVDVGNAPRTIAVVIGPGIAELRVCATAGMTLVSDSEIESTPRALALLQAQRGCVIIDARQGAPWRREPLRSGTFDELPVLIWGPEDARTEFERDFPRALRVERALASTGAADVWKHAASLCRSPGGSKEER